jgi:hypothetical protein
VVSQDYYAKLPSVFEVPNPTTSFYAATAFRERRKRGARLGCFPEFGGHPVREKSGGEGEGSTPHFPVLAEFLADALAAT